MNEPKLLIQCDAVKEPPKESGIYMILLNDENKTLGCYDKHFNSWNIIDFSSEKIITKIIYDIKYYYRSATLEEIKKLLGLFDKEEMDKHYQKALKDAEELRRLSSDDGFDSIRF